MYLVNGKPVPAYSDDELLLVAVSSPIGGIFFASLAPVVAIGIVYLRYQHTDPRLAPRGATDALMWICVLAMLGLGGYVVYLKFA